MTEIRDCTKLEAWLNGRPAALACAIAARTALRAAPLFCESLHEDETARRHSIVLQGFRALAAANFAGSWPGRCTDIRHAARTAVREIGNIVAEESNHVQMSRIDYTEIAETLPDGYLATVELNSQAFGVAARAVDAAVQAAQAVVDMADATNGLADPAAVIEAAVSAVSCALNAVDGAHGNIEFFASLEGDDEKETEPYITEFWQAVERDADLLDAGKEETGAPVNATVGLFGRSLWPDGIPTWASRRWADLKEKLPEAEKWRVWIDWYEARFAGHSGNEILEFRRATIATEDWKQGPTHVNAIIAKRIMPEIDPSVVAIAHGFQEVDAVRQIVDLDKYAAQIRNALPGDPSQAIGATKDMLEATMKTILSRRGKKATRNIKFSELMSECLSELGLAEKAEPTTEGERHIRTIASSARKMIGAAIDLRNSAGAGHGRVVGEEPVVTVADANLVAATGLVLAAWLVRHYGDA